MAIHHLAELGRRGAVALCLSVAAVNRVSSVVPFFLGRMAGTRNTDTFDVKQGVEMLWRELAGQPPTEGLRRELRERISGIRLSVAESGVTGDAVAVAAIDSIAAVLADPRDGRDYLIRSMGSALGVPYELDGLGVDPPAGFSSWMAYELHGQAGLFETLPVASATLAPEVVSDLRMRSGEDAMEYRNAMKSLPR